MKKRIVLGISVLMCSMMIFSGCTKGTSSGDNVTIKMAAAASLKNVFDDELIPMFKEEHKGISVVGTYDSSGKLQTQIEQGMDVDLFFSASPKQMTALEDEGLIDKDSIVDVLENKIVLIVPSGKKEGFSEFRDIVNAKTVAVGDPESVPAGQYAKEALQSLELWEKVKEKASFGTNVTEVLNWVAEESADAGIVYSTDAASNEGVEIVSEAPEGSLKNRIIYPAGIISGGKNKEATSEFLNFLMSKEASDIFKKYGFTPLN